MASSSGRRRGHFSILIPSFPPSASNSSRRQRRKMDIDGRLQSIVFDLKVSTGSLVRAAQKALLAAHLVLPEDHEFSLQVRELTECLERVSDPALLQVLLEQATREVQADACLVYSVRRQLGLPVAVPAGTGRSMGGQDSALPLPPARGGWRGRAGCGQRGTRAEEWD